MKKINGVVNKKITKILVFVVLDVLALILSSLASVGLRFDFSDIPSNYLLNSYRYLIYDFIIMFVIFMFFKLYTSMWTYASIVELIDIIFSCIFFECVSYAYKGMFKIEMPRSYYIIQLLLLVLFVCMSRFSFRFIRFLIINVENKRKKNNTMIIGAGSAGKLLINEINNNQKGFTNRIMCIIDDDKNKNGTYINGIPVVGGRREIQKYCTKYNINEIIIAIPSASKEVIGKISEECSKTKCNIKILPAITALMDDNDSKEIMKKMRPLSYEDFLGRDQIVVDNNEIIKQIKDKVILVTGGGGSIGSELSRQIAKADPKQLIIFDIYENNAYDIEQELKRDYPKLNLKAIIGSVRDYDRLEDVFKTYKPDAVFHAAAHKHVPLMEVSPNEAIKNNCLGTLNAAKLADKYKVKRFVLISTDKAVRPTNVMGATKRICEMIVQSYDKKSKNTEYVAVRFGNVLGSNGSVIPLFLKQIENGGPVTVTHKEITRFFMTIPEAVSLVLQASVYAKGGEIFVLDMGKPVKIYDLAKKIIRYKGFEPNVDIKIEITGLRPGEKLYEEILMDEEGLKETPNKLIHIGKPIKFDSKKFEKNLENLIKSSYENRNDIKEKVAKIVTTYKIDKKN